MWKKVKVKVKSIIIIIVVVVVVVVVVVDDDDDDGDESCLCMPMNYLNQMNPLIILLILCQWPYPFGVFTPSLPLPGFWSRSQNPRRYIPGVPT